ncbi:MAG TPA: NADH-quinone oxidoreductase subunit NuoG [Gammaproteobacteria bacterium]|nr:NADH-quinone oxidoreductase subunit NuoG [Gammaproteobacteria bacterium]
MADIDIEIDGRKLTAKPNQTIIEVADAMGIYIPRFCYHKQLSIAANCRMCLVDVEKSPKTLPACATLVTPGMKVFTKSIKTIEAQRAVMQFLLINHPLDCPICDQGGECELQDLAMGYGSAHSHYDECKRAVADQDLGPLIATDMTRCIYCTRCVRFGEEVAGMREIGGTYRGEHTDIGTFVQQAMQSEISGNIIDLCPVGALTSKPFRFAARAWELDQTPSISPHDCLGSNINVHTRYGKVMRVVARENHNINETWLSDRDRFSYTALDHPERLEEPMARVEGKWQPVGWQQAFELATEGLREIIAEFGADKLGALASPNSTLEEFYLLQKIVRGLGSPHIDHRLREIDVQDQAIMPLFPGLTIPLADLETCDEIVLIGSNIQKEQPLAALRVRKAALQGATVVAINPVDYQFNFKVTTKKIIAPHLLPQVLADMVQAFNLSPVEQGREVEILKAKKTCILLGALALHHPHASHIRYLANKLAILMGAKLGYMTDGANTAGGWLAGAIPHRQAGGVAIHHQGLSAYEQFVKPRKAYILLNVEPELDCANSKLAISALKQAQFVLALSLYRHPTLETYANVILPIAAFAETSGTYVNVMGEWQSFTGVASAYRSTRPAWKILRVLGNFLGLSGFNDESSEEVRREVKEVVAKSPLLLQREIEGTLLASPHFVKKGGIVSRIGEIPIYATDSIVRHAEPLQKTQVIIEGDVATVQLNIETANKLQLHEGDQARVKQGHGEIYLPVTINSHVATDAARIAGGIMATAELGDLLGEVVIEHVK